MHVSKQNPEQVLLLCIVNFYGLTFLSDHFIEIDLIYSNLKKTYLEVYSNFLHI
jgi:hypothetical protein